MPSIHRNAATCVSPTCRADCAARRARCGSAPSRGGPSRGRPSGAAMTASAHATQPPDARPLVIFGACDRHNLGDLLFPHIIARMMAAPDVRVAGLVARDLREYGGHRVEAIGTLVSDVGGTPITLVHAGGELLTCTAWEAAVMLLPPAQARAVVARLDA